MALKTEKTAETAAPVPAEVPTTVVELALYTQYTWLGETYEKGKPYRFKNSVAMELLAEQDCGRPVWKLYQAPKIKKTQQHEVVDATKVQFRVEHQPEQGMGHPTSVVGVGGKRIDVGDDSEIADLLPKDTSEDITV